ncbi:MAG: tetratricopeptide repeat protein [Verrucomicrobia bacterium]|nr:tetratricopeptide repeat protein [Verrucomicrobiota bacterium]
MNAARERAILLFQQKRHELAEKELRQLLTAEPHDAHAHALLALCMANQKKFEEAIAEARQSVHLAPDFGFAHYAVACVLYDQDKNAEAEAAIQEAIRLEPNDADYFALLAGIRCDLRRWDEALAAADQGLAADPEHVSCTNLRAMALVKLGRRAEAKASIGSALSKDPDNATTHANQGWALLHDGNALAAMEHFREALRLDPQQEWARQGILEALKARNIIYRWILLYFLWMSRLSKRAQWGVIIGGYIAYRMLASISKAQPELAPLLTPLMGLYAIFVILTWTAAPLFNLLLRLDRFGRYALSREEIVASNWIGACLLGGILLVGVGLLGRIFPLVLGGIGCAAMMLPVGGTFSCSHKRGHKVLSYYTVTLAALGLLGLILALADQPAAGHFAMLFLFGFFGFGWVANTYNLKD